MGATPQAGLVERELPAEEWSLVEPIFVFNGTRLPHKETARIFVAERGGDLVGMAVMQMVPHLEPIWIEKGKGEHALRGLIHMAEASLEKGSGDYYAFSTTLEVGRLCEAFGMTHVPWVIYKKGA